MLSNDFHVLTGHENNLFVKTHFIFSIFMKNLQFLMTSHDDVIQPIFTYAPDEGLLTYITVLQVRGSTNT